MSPRNTVAARASYSKIILVNAAFTVAAVKDGSCGEKVEGRWKVCVGESNRNHKNTETNGVTLK
jgi:hypothetical protein